MVTTMDLIVGLIIGVGINVLILWFIFGDKVPRKKGYIPSPKLITINFLEMKVKELEKEFQGLPTGSPELNTILLQIGAICKTLDYLKKQ